MLELDQVRAGYGAINVLWDVTLSVQAGQLTTIIGPNGAGKTTLLRAIMGLVPVSQGRIALNGKPLNGTPTWDMADASVAMIPEGRMVFRDMSEDNLDDALTFYVARKRNERRRTQLSPYRRMPGLSTRVTPEPHQNDSPPRYSPPPQRRYSSPLPPRRNPRRRSRPLSDFDSPPITPYVPSSPLTQAASEFLYRLDHPPPEIPCSRCGHHGHQRDGCDTPMCPHCHSEVHTTIETCPRRWEYILTQTGVYTTPAGRALTNAEIVQLNEEYDLRPR